MCFNCQEEDYLITYKCIEQRKGADEIKEV